MIGRRTAVGLSLLCALLFSAIAVQNASAASATNTTAMTCIEKGGFGFEDFSDSHCDQKVTPGTGSFVHEVIAKNQTTEIEGVQLSNAVLKSKAAGAAVEVTCTTVKETGTLRNEEAFGKHMVNGTMTIVYTNCTVNKPAKCVISEPIAFKTEFEGVEELGPELNGMGIEFTPDLSLNLFELTFKDKNKGVEECNIEGTFPITGTMVATGAPSPSASQSGATTVFSDAMTTETLKFGPEKASLESTTTLRMKGGGPISFTTNT